MALTLSPKNFDLPEFFLSRFPWPFPRSDESLIPTASGFSNYVWQISWEDRPLVVCLGSCNEGRSMDEGRSWGCRRNKFMIVTSVFLFSPKHLSWFRFQQTCFNQKLRKCFTDLVLLRVEMHAAPGIEHCRDGTSCHRYFDTCWF